MTTLNDDFGYPEGDVAVAAERLGQLIAELPWLTPGEVRERVEAEQLALLGAARLLERRRDAEGARRRELERAVRRDCTLCRVRARGEPAWSWRSCKCDVDCGVPGCEPPTTNSTTR